MLRAFLFILGCIASGVAYAGAFMQAPEHGQVIAELGFSEAGVAYDAFGREGAIPSWRKFELSAYGEYGLADWLTLIGEPSWFAFRAKPPGVSRTRLGASEAGARVRIVEWEDNILSAQATARYATGGRGGAEFSDMGQRAQVDVRLLYGRKIELFGFGGYVDTQVGFRSRGAYGHQLRFDATWALRPLTSLTLMLQSFTTITPGRLGDKFMLSQKIKASAVYDLTQSLSLQVGLIAALRGVNAAAERGVVSAVLWRF